MEMVSKSNIKRHEERSRNCDMKMCQKQTRDELLKEDVNENLYFSGKITGDNY